MDMGLSIYLDNRQVDVFDPTSHESFIKGIYQKHFWIIELEVNNMRNKCQSFKESNTTKTIAYLTTEHLDNEPRYMTRSKTKITDKLQILETDVKSIGDAIQSKIELTETNSQAE